MAMLAFSYPVSFYWAVLFGLGMYLLLLGLPAAVGLGMAFEELGQAWGPFHWAGLLAWLWLVLAGVAVWSGRVPPAWRRRLSRALPEWLAVSFYWATLAGMTLVSGRVLLAALVEGPSAFVLGWEYAVCCGLVFALIGSLVGPMGEPEVVVKG